MPEREPGSLPGDDPARTAAQPEPPTPTSPARQYRRRRGRHIENAVMSALVSAGLIPHTYLLTTRGRKSGRPRRNPVTLVREGEHHWLVAPYGPVPWVCNARAAGQVTVSRRGRERSYTVRELAAPEAAPVLKRYVRLARAARPYFRATIDSPLEAFTAEADHHPVFELNPLGRR